MKINDFLKSINYEAKMGVLGEMKNFKYYIRTDMPKGEDIGLPLIIVENKKSHHFEVCGADQALSAMRYFNEH